MRVYKIFFYSGYQNSRVTQADKIKSYSEITFFYTFQTRKNLIFWPTWETKQVECTE